MLENGLKLKKKGTETTPEISSWSNWLKLYGCPQHFNNIVGSDTQAVTAA